MHAITPDILLQLSIAIPWGSAILLFFHKTLGKALSQAVAFLGFLCPLAISLSLAYCFPYYVDSQTGYAYFSNIDTGLSFIGIQLTLGLNGIAIPLFILAGVVGLCAGLYTLYASVDYLEYYWMLLLVMLGGLMGAFASINILFMYFFHEVALIPTFIMIGMWGGPNRRWAAIEMTVYLSLGALISLAGFIILYCNSTCNTFDLIQITQYLQTVPIAESKQYFIGGLLIFGLGILVSLFPFHSWAPRGYAAAPTATAMLHAGVLKKFGLYALIQVALPLLPHAIPLWSNTLTLLALGNILIIGLITLTQKDLKLMIGYSSVMHMGYCFLGLICCSPLVLLVGVGGTILLMFGHGLSVSLLFLLSTTIYRRTQTYDMQLVGGLGQKAPVLAALFITATFANIGLPGFANFCGEFAIFLALWKQNPYALIVAASGIIISAIYGLRAVANLFFGQPTQSMNRLLHNCQDITWSERIPALILIIGLMIVGFYPKSITNTIQYGLHQKFVQPILEKPSIYLMDQTQLIHDQGTPAK